MICSYYNNAASVKLCKTAQKMTYRRRVRCVPEVLCLLFCERSDKGKSFVKADSLIIDAMGLFLTLAFLFFIGSSLGWVIEVIFRRFFSSANPERKWINPGALSGPYLPLYGFGLCILYLLASLEGMLGFAAPFWDKVLMLLAMAVCMTVIEYIAGILCIKVANVRLWDYSEQWGNIQGIICPKYSLVWALLGAVYYFLIHPYILDALAWLSQNLAFSFVIGMFFGVFMVDLVYSAQVIQKIKKFAHDNHVIVKYENLKKQVRSFQDRNFQKPHFFFPFQSERPLTEHLKDMLAPPEKRVKKRKKR